MSAITSQTKTHRQAAPAGTNGSDLRRALRWVFAEKIFANVKLHGNIKWTPTQLVTLAVFWSWSAETSLVAAAAAAVIAVTRIFGSAPVASYQALTKALQRYTGQLLVPLWSRLQRLMEQCDPQRWRIGRWLVLAMDGSRISVPRTASNEARFCKRRKKRRKRKKGKKARRRNQQARRKRQARARRKRHYDPQPVGPQIWLTLLWHVGLRMPWCWRIGPSYASEREHVLQMVLEHDFPENTLLCGDPGFVGYRFWRAIHNAGRYFLVRVGSNVRLLKQLGYVRERHGLVYCWPDAEMRKKQPPLVLRLLRFAGPRGEVYLVTNVLDPRQLTVAQAKEIYARRWGVEVQFRTLKQTYQRGKLRSRTPENAQLELHWSLVSLWILQLFARKEQVKVGTPPERTSIAVVLRVLRRIIHEAVLPREQGQSLQSQLAKACTDSYQRRSKKASRNYPRRKEEPAAGPPVIKPATAVHKRQLRQIQDLPKAA